MAVSAASKQILKLQMLANTIPKGPLSLPVIGELLTLKKQLEEANTPPPRLLAAKPLF